LTRIAGRSGGIEPRPPRVSTPVPPTQLVDRRLCECDALTGKIPVRGCACELPTIYCGYLRRSASSDRRQKGKPLPSH